MCIFVNTDVKSPKSRLVKQTFNGGPILGVSQLSRYYPPVEKQLPVSSWVVNSVTSFKYLNVSYSPTVNRSSFSLAKRTNFLTNESIPPACAVAGLDRWTDEKPVKLCSSFTMPSAATRRHFRKPMACCLIKYGDRPCHGSGGSSPASHRGSQGSNPGRSMWDLW